MVYHFLLDFLRFLYQSGSATDQELFVGERWWAKVAWPVITLPTALGGLGIVDPACQSRALLGKLIVRGLLPGAEPWKEFLVHRLSRCTPVGRRALADQMDFH